MELSRRLLAGVIGLLVAGATPHSLCAEPKADVEVEVVGLSVSKPDPTNEFGGSAVPGRMPGVQVTLRANAGERTIVAVSFGEKDPPNVADDQETALSKREDNEWYKIHPQISDDGQTATLQINASALPAKDANRLRIDGRLVAVTGMKTAAAESKIAFKQGEKVKLGKLSVEISEVGEPDWGDDPLAVEFRTSAPGGFTAIKNVEFYDADGKLIESTGGGTSTLGIGAGRVYSQEFRLAEKLDRGTIKTTYYQNLIETVVPLKLDVGLGL